MHTQVSKPLLYYSNNMDSQCLKTITYFMRKIKPKVLYISFYTT